MLSWVAERKMFIFNLTTVEYGFLSIVLSPLLILHTYPLANYSYAVNKETQKKDKETSSFLSFKGGVLLQPWFFTFINSFLSRRSPPSVHTRSVSPLVLGTYFAVLLITSSTFSHVSFKSTISCIFLSIIRYKCLK